MTLEEIRGSNVSKNDRFPVGMRVLAVDDDRVCLKLLDDLLRKCQYHVLSAYGDTPLVMKGITHGACDYLVKPVRIEVLKNIWQHVVRRKKFESKSSCLDKDHQENRGGGKGDSPTDNAKGKLQRKRKDDEEDEENEDPTAQKKPRVVWAGELQMKFVAAVQKLEQLGEKVIAKRILDLMNVKGITRENVASHLQKYRIMLRRIQSMEDQPTNTVVELGGKDFSSMPMTSVHGLGDFRTSSGSERVSNSGLSISQTGGILGSVNSPARISLHNLSSSALIQHNHAQNLSDPISNLGKPYSVISQANHKDGLFQRNPALLKIDQLAKGIPQQTQYGDYLVISPLSR